MKTPCLVRSLAALATLAALAALPGCASISKSECLSANWEDVGVRDGAAGRPEEYLINHSKACAKVSVTPDRESWLRGRERGLERYCVPHRMYQIGEYGGGFDVAICRDFDQDRLVSAYEKGREVHRLGSALSEINGEIQSIHVELKREDLTQKQREALAFRLGQLVYERSDTERALEDARYRASSL